MYSRVKKKIKKQLAKVVVKEPSKLPHGLSVVSFTFDDIPKSAALAGAQCLDVFNYKGTFYTAIDLLGSDGMANERDISKLIQKGHEIGCHTFSHISCSSSSENDVSSDCDTNRAAAIKMFDVVLESFAYPFGEISPNSKRVIKRAYRSARSVDIGLNQGKMDLASLKAVPIYENSSLEYMLRCIDTVSSEGGWLIFYTHDVSSSPSQYGVSIAKLRDVIDYTSKSGAHVLPVRDVVSKYLSRRH